MIWAIEGLWPKVWWFISIRGPYIGTMIVIPLWDKHVPAVPRIPPQSQLYLRESEKVFAPNETGTKFLGNRAQSPTNRGAQDRLDPKPPEGLWPVDTSVRGPYTGSITAMACRMHYSVLRTWCYLPIFDVLLSQIYTTESVVYICCIDFDLIRPPQTQHWHEARYQQRSVLPEKTVQAHRKAVKIAEG